MLRQGVEVSREGPLVVLTDRVLGFAAEFPGPAGELIEALNLPRGELLARVRAVAETDEPEAVLEEFLGQLSELGFLAGDPEPTSEKMRQHHARARQEERATALRDAVNFARSHTVFHRKRLAPGITDSAAAWNAAPVMTRADLRAGFPHDVVVEGLDLAAEIDAGRVAISTTSGTTDERVQVASIAGAGSAGELLRRFMGIPENVKMARGAALTTPVCSGTACHLGDSTLAERTEGVTTFLTTSSDLMTMSRDEIARVVAELAEVSPDVFFVHPWYAVFVGLRARELGIELPAVPVILMTYQFATARHRRLLRELFRGETRSFYSATETGGYLIANECSEGALHLREDHIHLDFEPTGVNDSTGELQRVLVTNLVNKVMPLVRYRVGDLARPGPPCACPWGPEWGTIVIDGRARDVLFTAQGRAVTIREIDAAVGNDLFDFYTISQTALGSYRAQIICDGDDGCVFTERLKAVLGEEANVAVRRVSRLTPERSLKFRQTRVECELPWPSPAV